MRDVEAHVRVFAMPRLPARDPSTPRFIPKPRWTPQRFGERVLVFDTETTEDPAQRLLVGAYQLHEWSDTEAAYRLVEAGLVRGDGLPPVEAALLRRYAASHDLPLLSREEFCVLLTVEGHDLSTLVAGFNLKFDLGALALPRIRCRQRTARAKVRYRPGWGQGRGRWRRGFRISVLDTFTRPVLRLRSAGPGSTFIEWGAYTLRGEDGTVKGRRPFKGRFLDLREAAHALAGETAALEGACALFGIPYKKRRVKYGRITRPLLDYLREDVAATHRLFLAVREEWNRHPFIPVPSPRLPAHATAADTPDLAKGAVLLSRMRSPASLAKAYLDRMGLRPRLVVQPDFPREALGQAMEAFYGGRIEARADLQGAILPVVSLDILSTYLSMNMLLGLHRWDTAARLRVEDATDEVRALLARLTLDGLFRPDVWPGFSVFCESEPRGDVLPIRYPDAPGDAPTCHMARVHLGTPGLTLWYALPDLLYSKFVTGQAPVIRRAWRLVPEGVLPGLRPIRFRGEVTLNPRTDYLRAFRDARLRDVQPRLEAARAAGRDAEAQALDRLQRAMKAVGEPLGFGVYVEVDEKDLIPRDAFRHGTARADVWTGRGRFEARIAREECPGRWFFSPRGAMVTAGARLLLGMMGRRIVQAGGSIVSMHTDSVIVAATETGGEVWLPPRPGTKEPQRTVRALPFAEVERIREQFIPLSGISGVSLWKRERTNDPHPDATRDRNLYVLSHGPGRYALFNHADDGRVVLRDRKETALGHLVPPDGHTRSQATDAVWTALVREAHGERNVVSSLPFAKAPALGRLPITTPDALSRIHTRPRGARSDTTAAPRPFGFFTVAYTMSDQPLFGRHIYWSGWCRLKRKETVGCPVPREACPHRAACPLAYPIQPATYDVPDASLPKKARWFDARTGRPLPRLHTMPMDTWPQGLRVRTWAEYVRHTLARGAPWWEAQDPDVRIIGLVYTGKEARHLEDIAASLRVPGDEVLYYTPEVPDLDTLRTGTQRHSPSALAHTAHLDRHTVKRFSSGQFVSLDPRPLQRLAQAVLRLDAQAAMGDPDALLRAALQGVPAGFLARETGLDRVSIWRFQRGHTRHLRPAHRALLWQAYSAWIREHPEAGLIVPDLNSEVAGG
jgi:hypothetical protein